jgi:hypothetical protein
MYLVVAGTAATVLLLAAAVLAVGVYRVLKSVHTRPRGAAAPPSHDAAPTRAPALPTRTAAWNGPCCSS